MLHTQPFTAFLNERVRIASDFLFFRPIRQIFEEKVMDITNRTPNVLVENLSGMRQVLYSRKRFIPCATAGSRTRVNGLGSRHDNRYTTVAHAPVNGKVWLFNSSLSYSCIISYFWPSSGLDFTHWGLKYLNKRFCFRRVFANSQIK